MINFIKRSFQILVISIFPPVCIIGDISGALINKITLKIYRNIEKLRKYIIIFLQSFLPTATAPSIT